MRERHKYSLPMVEDVRVLYSDHLLTLHAVLAGGQGSRLTFYDLTQWQR